MVETVRADNLSKFFYIRRQGQEGSGTVKLACQDSRKDMSGNVFFDKTEVVVNPSEPGVLPWFSQVGKQAWRNGRGVIKGTDGKAHYEDNLVESHVFFDALRVDSLADPSHLILDVDFQDGNMIAVLLEEMYRIITSDEPIPEDFESMRNSEALLQSCDREILSIVWRSRSADLKKAVTDFRETKQGAST